MDECGPGRWADVAAATRGVTAARVDRYRPLGERCPCLVDRFVSYQACLLIDLWWMARFAAPSGLANGPPLL